MGGREGGREVTIKEQYIERVAIGHYNRHIFVAMVACKSHRSRNQGGQGGGRPPQYINRGGPAPQYINRGGGGPAPPMLELSKVF